MALATKLTFLKFLENYRIKSNKNDNSSSRVTHTRMADTRFNIIPGSFSIPDSEMNLFYELLYNDVVSKQGKEYLTEAQLYRDNDGKERCIAIDFDFNYEINGKPTRYHTQDDTFNIICSLLSSLKTIFNFASNPEKFNIYVFERKAPYECARKNCVKDGIHIIIGFKADNLQQTILRDMVVEELPRILSGLPLVNTISDVFDNSITSGKTNWQLYGCRKPGIEPYLLSCYYTVEWNVDDDDYVSEYHDGSEFPMKEKLSHLSVRNTNIPQYDMNDEFRRTYDAKKNNSSLNTLNKERFKLKVTNTDNRLESIQPESIKNEHELLKALQLLYNSIGDQPDMYYGSLQLRLKEVHDIAMILPQEYSDDYDKWIRLGWALFNTSSSDYMFYTWMLISSKSEKFDYDDIPHYYSDKYWSGFKSFSKNGYTTGSIIYWAKEHWKKCPKEEENKFETIKGETLDYLINQTIKQPTDFDLAKVLYHFCKDKFVCVDIRNSTWYEFTGHRFLESDHAVNLRLTINTDMYQLYHNRMMKIVEMLRSIENGSPVWAQCQEQLKTLSHITKDLKDARKKDKMLQEAKLLFYDEKFIQKIDENHKLLGCNNGVVDFHTNTFRNGETSDYISKSTNIDYIPINKVDPNIIKDINEFMEKLFPDPKLLDYMWEMLASCLVGNNKNQLFHIFTGGGSNGKSLLVVVMKKILGEYYGVVPGGIITDKKTKIGGVSPEIMELKGKRLAVINEPSKGEKINEGPLKALTGGDDIQGRSLFKNSVTFKPSFKLIVCTNYLYDIEANDEGTWRRIKVVPFMSYFTDDPDPTKSNEFKKDMDLEDKILQHWVEPFFSMLVEVAFRTGGSITKKCDMVDASSNEYRNTQDHIINFMNEKIKESPGDRIKKGELQREFEDWYKMNYGNKRNGPKMKEIYPIMDKKYGKHRSTGWHNITIIHDDDEDEDEDD